MKTQQLLHKKMEEKGYSKTKLQNAVGCCEKTLRHYIKGSTKSGPYLTKILAFDLRPKCRWFMMRICSVRSSI